MVFNYITIKKGIENEAPNFYKDYKEVLNNVPKIRCFFDDTIKDGGFYTPGSAKITLNDISVQAHEYCHFLFHDPFMRKGIIISKPWWLDEGIAEYLNVVYCEAYTQWMKDELYGIANVTLGYLEQQGLINDGFKIWRVGDIIKKNNIETNNIKEIVRDKNKRLIWNDISWLSSYKFYKVTDNTDPYGDYFDKGVNSGLMLEEHKLNIYANYSFMSYIIEEYGLEKILYLSVADFKKQTYEEVFGKSFNELKSDWINHLKENIKDIELLL